MALALLAAPKQATAQFSFSPVAGAIQYDAALDDHYFTWGLQVRYHVSPSVRIGVLGSTSDIGYVPRDWMLPASNERLWRVGGIVELAAVHPFRKSKVPVVDHLSLTAKALLGVLHSSGVELDPDAGNGDPFYGITDDPTGLGFGGGLGLEFGPLWISHGLPAGEHVA